MQAAIDLNSLRRELIAEARELHAKETDFVLESVLVLGKLERLRADTAFGWSTEQYIKHIGLTPNVYWKRLKAARMFRAFPKTLAMVKAGETSVSVVAMLHPKLTQANEDLVLEGIRNKTKREAEQFLSRVTLDGRMLAKEPEVELRLTLTQGQLALLERAREVLAAAGHVPANAEVLVKALGDLLERRDPLRKATRVAARRAKRGQAAEVRGAAMSPETEPGNAMSRGTAADVSMPSGTETGDAMSPGTKAGDATSSGTETGDATSLESESGERIEVAGAKRLAARPDRGVGSSSPGTRRPAVPAAVRHAVVLRDGGRCTEVLADGSRCTESMMLEMDHHRVMYCRGGRHTVDDLVLKYRRHNQAAAERELGAEWMSRWQTQGRPRGRTDPPAADPR